MTPAHWIEVTTTVRPPGSVPVTVVHQAVLTPGSSTDEQLAALRSVRRHNADASRALARGRLPGRCPECGGGFWAIRRVQKHGRSGLQSRRRTYLACGRCEREADELSKRARVVRRSREECPEDFAATAHTKFVWQWAERCGVSPSTIRYWARLHGVKCRPAPKGPHARRIALEQIAAEEAAT